MKINTKYFGEVDIDDQRVISFPRGLPGFEQEKKFVLQDIDESGMYQVLQSIHIPAIALVVANPYLFFQNYEFDIEDNMINLLEIQSSEELTILSVLTIQEPFSKTTANLQAPIIINRKTNKGRQLILMDTVYETKHLITSPKEEGEGIARVK